VNERLLRNVKKEVNRLTIVMQHSIAVVTSVCLSVRLSVRLSHAGIVAK